MTFIHLRAHTSYSLLRSAISIPRLAELCVANMMPAVGITDLDNMFGALEASDKLAAAGVQPIIGTSLVVEGWGRLNLLAMNEAGYASLCKLSSAANLRPAGRLGPSVAVTLLAKHAEGLLALSGGLGGAIGSAIRDGKELQARDRLSRLSGIFGDRLYVEIQRHGNPEDTAIELGLIQLAYDLDLPIVATHEALFAEPADYDAHDVLLAIAEGKPASAGDRRRVSRQQWLKPQADMKALFADLPEAIASTVEIAKRCAWRVRGRKPLLPHVSDNEAADLRQKATDGLAARLQDGPAPGYAIEDYLARLSYECDVISKMGFAGYFLIVADFIGWAKANGIPVGPGRGSGAGSVVAWSLSITDLDPLRFGLLFERFLNPDRVSMPDFDIDFCQERRGEVIAYVQQRYGVDRVAQIITHGKLQARAVLRDVGRALSMPYGQVDRICKLIPNNPADPVTIEEAMEIEPRIAEEAAREESAGRLIEIAQRLEGLYRHASTHAAGLVIGDRPLDELIPLCADASTGSPVTQFNWKAVEAAGLVKFDFLGLKTLTVIRKTLEQIEQARGVRIDITRIPLDDQPTYELLAAADTIGVFQLESDGMRGALRQLSPDRFEDIIAMVALYRPGPMDNIPAYVARRHGREAIEYPHEILAPILEETYGVIIYQEQVIQIAQVLSGYTLGQADLLRRAMGKKDKDEMAKQRARFTEGAAANGIDPVEASAIFDLVDKFAGYGFNKSHAAAYALIAYQTAYLKANYCEEFLAASMTLDMSDTDKVAVLADECRRAGIRLLPPCVNTGDVEFSASPSTSSIRYALAGLKNVGAGAAEAIASERRAAGPFASIREFARRVDTKTVSKRVIEMLASSGALDDLVKCRATAHANAGEIVEFAKLEAESTTKGVLDLFGDNADGGRVLALKPARPWKAGERLHAEYQSIGHYLSGHPLDDHRNGLSRLGVTSRRDLDVKGRKGKATALVAAVCLGKAEKMSKAGNRFAWLSLSDERGAFEVIVFSETLELSREAMIAGNILVLSCQAEPAENGVRYVAWQLADLDEFTRSNGRALRRA